MKKRVLVTGGAGYIGSHTCKHLALHGYEPIVYDNLSYGYKEFVRWGELVIGDILDTEKLSATLKKYQPVGVIHFASLIAVGESVQKPDIYYRNNISGSLSLLEAMRASEVQNIVVSSTCAIYGEPEAAQITEDAPIRPLNPYAVSKAVMERMLDDFGRAYGLHSVSLRYFNASGADSAGEVGERHVPETHLIPCMFLAAEGEIPEMKLFGDDYPTADGTCVRDYIHVEDLARAHRLALEKLLTGEAQNLKVNLGTGSGYSVREMLKKTSEVIGKQVPYSISPRRAGDSPILVAQNDYAKKALGWSPENSNLEHIIHTAWEWFKKDAAQRKKLLGK